MAYLVEMANKLKKEFLRAASVFLLVPIFCTQVLYPATIKILPLGDSIIYRSGKDEVEKIQNYRYSLWKMLLDA